MSVLEAIVQRRSIRKYKEKPIPKDLLYKILDAGRWAPSAHNSQPCMFIILEDEKVRRQVAEATTYGKFLAKAPVGVAVVVDPEATNHPAEDGAAATQNMLLAAHALGLGACWIGSYSSVYEENVKEILGIPKNKILLSIVALGYPDEKAEKTRKSLDQTVLINRYEQRD